MESIYGQTFVFGCLAFNGNWKKKKWTKKKWIKYKQSDFLWSRGDEYSRTIGVGGQGEVGSEEEDRVKEISEEEGREEDVIEKGSEKYSSEEDGREEEGTDVEGIKEMGSWGSSMKSGDANWLKVSLSEVKQEKVKVYPSALTLM